MREDCWTESDDKALSSTVLDHISNGHTKRDAYDKLSLQLKRTPAAVAFRWQTIKHLYAEEVAQAKLEGLAVKRSRQKEQYSFSLRERKRFAKEEQLEILRNLSAVQHCREDD